MADANFTTPREAIRHELGNLRNEWWWFLILGVLLIVAGTTAISYAMLATAVAVVTLGFLMIFGGAAQIVAAFWSGKWSGFLIALLAGLLYVVVGGLFVARPGEGAEALTLLIGSFFLVGGIFRVVGAMTLKLHHWGWLLLNGIITVMLGIMVLAEWPQSGFFIIGILIGVDMLFNGWAWVMLGFGLRSLPKAS